MTRLRLRVSRRLAPDGNSLGLDSLSNRVASGFGTLSVSSVAAEAYYAELARARLQDESHACTFPVRFVGRAQTLIRLKCPEDAPKALFILQTDQIINLIIISAVAPGPWMSVMTSLARTDLQSAIQTNEIIPFYQPIVDLDSGQPKGFEILARWDSAAYGRVVPPDEFIQFAEGVGLLESLTESVFSQAAETAASWPEHLTLWLNLAPCQLSARGLVERLFHIAVTAAFNLENLVVEVTEGTCLLSEIKARREADEMQSLGIQLAIDDFGVGYSNIERLASLPFNILKVDSTFIADISKRDSARRKVQSMLRAAVEMGLDTVAEGIENDADAEVVRDLGIKKGQGWLFGRPEKCPRILSESTV